MSSTANLNNDELCQKLKEYGISSPVTATTRGILLKKLNNAIANSRKIGKFNGSSNSNIKNNFSSIGKKLTKRKNNYALSNFSSDEDDNDDSDFSGPKTRLRSLRHSNDSSPIEYSRLQTKRKLAKSFDDSEELSLYNDSSVCDETTSRNDTPIRNNTPLNRGRLSRRRQPEIDDISFLNNNNPSFSDSDIDDPLPRVSDKSKRDEPDNPAIFYKNFKLFDRKDDKRNLPLVSKNLQRGTEIRIIHNRNSPSNRILNPDEIVSHGMPSYQTTLPNGISSSETSKVNSFQESCWSQTVSIFLVVLCICFFLFVGLCYINIQTSYVSPLNIINYIAEVFSPEGANLNVWKQVGGSTVQNLNIYDGDALPICTDSNTKYCLSKKEYEALPKLLQIIEKAIVPELAKQGSLYQCGRRSEHFMRMNHIALLFLTHLPLVSQDHVKEGMNGFAKLVATNSDFGLETIWDNDTSDPVGLAVFPLPREHLCYALFLFYNIMCQFAYIFIGVAMATVVYQLIRYKRKCSQKQEQKTFEVVERILQMLENSCMGEGKNYVAVNHIRDCIIPPRDRKANNALWNRAVKFIDDHDSRVNTEIRLLGGEEYQVWRWVAGAPRSPVTQSPTSPVEKSWQGKAFDSLESPQNFPPVSPTVCLKVRKMFDGELMFGNDWPQKVQDNLLQKCEAAKILHVAVDKDSKEGCVYVKCASPYDAGVAFRALHGTWYDGNLVTVKYLREEKYHERFPASRNIGMALRSESSSVRIQRR